MLARSRADGVGVDGHLCLDVWLWLLNRNCLDATLREDLRECDGGVFVAGEHFDVLGLEADVVSGDSTRCWWHKLGRKLKENFRYFKEINKLHESFRIWI